ncbi:PepSY domain-containing protein [Actimicrobium antarcticum]|uniref:PepSY domain-containing protein n=1 Tax=Actimicrobium antarcticum TaxID=1051899 RepID=A0ABP7TD38_9BURK
MRHDKLALLAFVLAAAGTASCAAEVPAAQPPASLKPLTGAKLASTARITMADARAIALKAHPGKITDEELENEDGGSGLRYSFDIKVAKGTQEVGVDAMTGNLLENKLEGKNPD